MLPAHTYAPGIYTVGLTATDEGGQSKSTTALVVVSATAGDGITLSGGGSSGQVAVATTHEGSFTTAGTPDQVLVADSGGSGIYTVNFGSNLTTPVTITGNGSSGDTLVVVACTQAPYMDRDDTAKVLGLAVDKVRIVPTATGGGFGSKLDVSLQPLIGLVALKTGRPAALAYTRNESMMSTTKRHPSEMKATIGRLK